MAADRAIPWGGLVGRGSRIHPESGVTLKGTGPAQRRYNLVLKIASGGMGAVYLGFQTGAAGFRRPVAIKRAHAHLAEDPEFRRMIINESRLASLVRHPNVVSVCDVEDVDGELFLVMEYVEGATLSELMASPRPLPLRLTLRIIADACRGLDALHSAVDDRGMPLGLVHRDVSPQNILVGIDGVARIADFGIAKAYEGTTSGLLRGKPAYMAPEYITNGIASPASDVFGLGVVAWECIARRRLFRVGTDVETLDRVRHVTIPPASTFEPTLPQAIEDALFRALARSVDERYRSARDFGNALESVSGDSALFARPETVGEHVQSIVREKLDIRRQALIEETPPHGGGPFISVPESAQREPVNTDTTPLTGHGPVRPPEAGRRHVGVAVALGVAVFAALFVLSLIRPRAPSERHPPAALEPSQATPLPAEPAPTPSVVVAPQVGTTSVRQPLAAPLRQRDVALVDGALRRAPPAVATPASAAVAVAPPPPPVETLVPVTPSAVPVAPPSPTSFVGAPPSEAPDNPYR